MGPSVVHETHLRGLPDELHHAVYQRKSGLLTVEQLFGEWIALDTILHAYDSYIATSCVPVTQIAIPQ